MKHIVQFLCFALFILMACSDEGGPVSNSNAESMATFSRLHERFSNFARIQESAQFATLGPGFTFENSAACGSAFIEVEDDFGATTRFELSSAGCIELNFDGQEYFYIFNAAPLNDDLWINIYVAFYGGRPFSGEYNLNCFTSDCDDVELLLRIVNLDGEEVVHYHGMPDLLTVVASTGSVSASFDGLFYPDDFEEVGVPFNVAGTLVCCD